MHSFALGCWAFLRTINRPTSSSEIRTVRLTDEVRFVLSLTLLSYICILQNLQAPVSTPTISTFGGAESKMVSRYYFFHHSLVTGREPRHAIGRMSLLSVCLTPNEKSTILLLTCIDTIDRQCLFTAVCEWILYTSYRPVHEGSVDWPSESTPPRSNDLLRAGNTTQVGQ